jgi:hypothetical protein
MAHELGHYTNPWEDTLTTIPAQKRSNVPSFTLPPAQSLMNINPDLQMQFSGRKPGWLDSTKTITDTYRNMYGGGSDIGLGKYFTADNMNAFGSAIGGLGKLASGWAALKNIGLQRDAYNTMKDQWERNYADAAAVTNNQIRRVNAWADAQGMPTSDDYIG